MKDLHLVIFDMDGLLFDTEQSSFKAMKKAMATYDLDFSLQTYKSLIGIDDQGTRKILEKIYGVGFPIDPILCQYELEFEEIVNKEGIKIKPGVRKLLDTLDDKGIKKCIASSSSRTTISKYLSITELTNRFDFYVSGEEVVKGKPNPDIFLEACLRANETPKHALVLEDSLHGFKAACKAGIRCVIVPDLIEPTQEMKKDSYSIVSNLEKVIDSINVPHSEA